MKHWWVKALSVGSLVLAMVVAGLWVRSYWVNDFVFFRVAEATPWGESWTVFSNRGCIKLGWQEDDVPTSPGLHYQRHEPTAWGEPATFWQRLGFSRDAGRNYRVERFTIHYQSILVPHWFVVGLLMALPAWRVIGAVVRGKRAGLSTKSETKIDV